VSVVDDIKPDDSGVKPDIRLGQLPADQVFSTVLQDPFDPVQSAEEFGDGFFVGFLGGSESGPVDSVVDRRVDPARKRAEGSARADENDGAIGTDVPLVQVVDLLLELVRIKIELGLFLGELVVEGLSP
jgi:hypothetical protein